MNQDWNAKSYTQAFGFVPQYGQDVMGLLDYDQVRTMLDLGCGNGALTAQFADKGLQVIGMDASAAMLERARQMYPELTFMQADATAFSLPEPVDAVFSNAVLHWIDEARQSAALHCIYRALVPGGQFVFEMGGYGCNRLIHGALAAAFSRRGRTYRRPQYFPTIGQYTPLLEQAGFKVVYATLFDRPTRLQGERGLQDWICMFVKSAFAGMTADEREAVIAEVAAELRPRMYQQGVWVADYVRLRVKAVKPVKE